VSDRSGPVLELLEIGEQVLIGVDETVGTIWIKTITELPLIIDSVTIGVDLRRIYLGLLEYLKVELLNHRMGGIVHYKRDNMDPGTQCSEETVRAAQETVDVGIPGEGKLVPIGIQCPGGIEKDLLGRCMDITVLRLRYESLNKWS
jgi:hypothetical protein